MQRSGIKKSQRQKIDSIQFHQDQENGKSVLKIHRGCNGKKGSGKKF